MRTDYKFWYIRKNDDGLIDEVAVRFYEGDYQDVPDEKGGTKNVYVRSKRLGNVDLPHLANIRTKKELGGAETKLFTGADFGDIRTEAELNQFLVAQLKKDPVREPVNEQK